jgi:hypothetical protein
MARKYSRIMSAAKYYSAIDNYIKYITDASKRGSKVGQGKPRPKSTKLYIDPFGVALADGQVVPTSASLTAWTAHKTKLGTHTSDTQSDETKIVKLEGFTPARVIITTGRSATGVAKTSSVTGLKYLSYGGTSTSLPFGRKSLAESQQAAFDEIRLQIVAGVSSALVTFKPEKF